MIVEACQIERSTQDKKGLQQNFGSVLLNVDLTNTLILNIAI